MQPNDGRVVSNLIVQAFRGNDITIYGDGSKTRSFCCVDNLIDGLIKMMNSGDKVIGPINFGNKKKSTVKELAELVLILTNSKLKIIYNPLPLDDPKVRCPNTDKAKNILKWYTKNIFRSWL